MSSSSSPSEVPYAPPSQPQPQPHTLASPREVPTQLERLRYEVDLAHDMLTALQDRLGPVLGPVSPEAAEEDEISCESDVGESIRQSNCQVQGLAGRLRRILQRLEV